MLLGHSALDGRQFLARSGAALASGLLLALGCAPVPPSSRIDVPVRQFTVTDARLPSGFQVIVEEDATARVVASALVVSAGAAADPPGLEGLAHLVEHLTFRGRHGGQTSVSAWLALHGIGSWNAFTQPDVTSYYLVGPPETLPWMIDLEVARMTAPLEGIDEAIFQAERGVVVAELRQRDESGQLQEVRRALLSQLFQPSHPYARGVGGTPETLARLTLADAQAWAKTHYRPRAMTWVLAGALDRKKTAMLLDQRVPAVLRDEDPLSPRVVHATRGAESQPPAPDTLPTVSAAVRRPTLLIGWKLPPVLGDNEPVFSTLPAMVNLGWFEAEGVASEGTGLSRFDDAGILTLELELEPDARPEEVWKRVRSLWRPERWSGGTLTGAAFVEGMFGQVRGAAIVGLARESESLVARALDRARRARLFHQAETIGAQNAAIGKLTYAGVRAAGATYVTSERARAVLLKPAGAEESEEPESPTADVPVAFAPEQVRAEYPPDAIARFVRGPSIAGVTTFNASNGLEVIAVPDPGAGLVTVTLGLRGGRLTSSPPGLPDRLRWSYQSFDYHRPEFIGATLSTWWTDDSGFLEYRGAAGNLPNILAMLSERVLTRGRVDPPKAVLARASATPETEAFLRRFSRALLGEPGAKAQLSTAQAAALDGDVAQRWLERVLNPLTSVLVVSGDIKGNLRDEVEHWLGRWRGPEKGPDSTLPPLSAGPGRLRLVRDILPSAKLVRVRFGCTARAGTLEDEIAFRLLATEVQRQWTTIERQTRGSSYGFDAQVEVRRDGTMRLLVTGRVDGASTRRMAVAVSQTWKALGAIGDREDKVNRLRWEYGRAYNVRFVTDDILAYDVLRHRLRGRSPTAVDEVPAALMRAGREQMARVGKQCQASAVLGLLGDARSLEVDAQLPTDVVVVAP